MGGFLNGIFGGNGDGLEGTSLLFFFLLLIVLFCNCDMWGDGDQSSLLFFFLLLVVLFCNGGCGNDSNACFDN